MNVQIHQVLSEVTGVSGIAVLDPILAGERDPLKLATCATGASGVLPTSSPRPWWPAVTAWSCETRANSKRDHRLQGRASITDLYKLQTHAPEIGLD
jgi:hypothetical protein